MIEKDSQGFLASMDWIWVYGMGITLNTMRQNDKSLVIRMQTKQL
jgi:hypothetical protein